MSKKEVLCLLSVLVCLLFSGSLAFWNYDYENYRIPITITNINSVNLTNYQLAVNVSYNQHMLPDFSDLRFSWFNITEQREVEIPYWIEARRNGKWAYVWIKVPYIPAKGNATVYMYYGNITPVHSESNVSAFTYYYNPADNLSTVTLTNITGIVTNITVDTSDYFSAPGSFYVVDNSNSVQVLGQGTFNNVNVNLSSMNINYSAYIKTSGWDGYNNDMGLIIGANTTDLSDRIFIHIMDYYYGLTTRYASNVFIDVKINGSLIERFTANYTTAPTSWTKFEVRTYRNASGIKIELYINGNFVLSSFINNTILSQLGTGIGFSMYGGYSNLDDNWMDDFILSPLEEGGVSYTFGKEELGLGISVYSPSENSNYYTVRIISNSSVYGVSKYTEAGGDVRNGLVLDLHMDEGYGDRTYDDSGNGNTGTINNMYALQFDGVDDNIVVNKQIMNSTCFAIAMWIKPLDFDAQWNLLRLQKTATDYGRVVPYIPTTAEFMYWQNGYVISTGYYLEANKWYFIVINDCSGSGVSIYINGELVKTDTRAFGDVYGTIGYITTIGTDNNSFKNNGRIAEVRLYNRTLSDTEIQDLYTHGPGYAGNTTGLVLWHVYSKKTLVDQSGNGNDGTAYGNPQWVVDGPYSGWRTGKFLKALRFDGVDDYVEIPHDFYTENSSLTWALWFMPTRLESKGWQYILNANGCNGGIVVMGDNKVYIEFRDAWCNFYLTANVTDVLQIGKWYFIAATYDSSTKLLRVYVDGKLVFETVRDSHYNWGYTDIGGWINSADNEFAGYIDEVRIYNRSLTAAEIQKLYEMGLARYHIKAYLNGNLVYENTRYENATQVILNFTELKQYLHDRENNFTVWVNDTDSLTPLVREKSVLFNIYTYPKFSGLSVTPESPQTYGIPGINFSIDWSDELNNIVSVWIEHNFTDTLNNYTMTNLTNGTFAYSFGKPAAGKFVYEICAKDSYGLVNCTPLFDYLVNPAPSNLTIYSSLGWSIFDEDTTTIKCSAIIPVSKLEINGILVSNPYTLTVQKGFYDVYCELSDTRNYTPASESKTLVVNGLFSCSDSKTFAFEENVSATTQYIVLNFTQLIEMHYVKPDLSDVWVSVNSSWINGTVLVVNSSGKPFELKFGNYYANVSHETGAIPNTNVTVLQVENTTYKQINYVAFVNMRDEETAQLLHPEGANVYGIIGCSLGENIFYIDNSTTQFLIASKDYITKIGIRVKYSADAYYTRLRYFTIKSNFITTNIYVADAFKTALDRIDFIMADPSHYNSMLQIYKKIENRDVIITEAKFDASHKASVYLIEDTDYYVRVIDPDGSITEYGIINVVSPETKTLGAPTLNLNQNTQLVADVITISANKIASGVLTIYYNDKSKGTENVTVTVKNESGNVVFEKSYGSVSEIYENVSMQDSKSYFVEFDIMHKDFGEVKRTIFVTSESGMVETGMNKNVLSLLVLGLLLLIAGITSYHNMLYGVFIFDMGLVMFKAFGWLTISTTSVFFIILLSVIGLIIYIKQGEGM